jgi:hypothetical protein
MACNDPIVEHRDARAGVDEGNHWLVECRLAGAHGNLDQSAPGADR